MIFGRYVLFLYSYLKYQAYYYKSSCLISIKSFILNKEDIVHLEGGDKILNACYSNARLLVYPSLYEGFGIPILEAFANNCPVACSDSSSLPEVAGDAALYFNPNDEQSIYDSISKISYSDQLRNELIIKGKIRLKN